VSDQIDQIDQNIFLKGEKGMMRIKVPPGPLVHASLAFSAGEGSGSEPGLTGLEAKFGPLCLV